MYSIYIFFAFKIVLFTVHRSWCVKNVHANQEGKHNQFPGGGGEQLRWFLVLIEIIIKWRKASSKHLQLFLDCNIDYIRSINYKYKL